MTVQFEIPGRVRGKGRPQFSKRGFAYTPAETRHAEAMIRSLASDAMEGRLPILGPVELTICVRIMYPKSWSEKRKQATVFVTGKPDCDNTLKGISDAMNGIVWQDDSQVAQLGMVRLYTREGPERVTVRICELGQTIAAHDERPLLQDAKSL